MDYKNKYNEALNRATAAYKDEDRHLKATLERIFPELKEDDDERTRKEIVRFIRMEVEDEIVGNKWVAWVEKQSETDETKAKILLINKGYPIDTNGTFPTYEEMYNIIREGLENQGEKTSLQANERAWLHLVSDVLTWKDGIGQYLDDPRVQELAKRLCSEYTQKLYSPSVLSNSSNIGKDEQKSAYKLEPKFKVGDWVVTSNGEVSQVISVNKDYDGYTLDNYNYVSGAWCDMYHLWTIDDAKDGDVLISSVNKPFIYDGHFDEIIVGAYCGLYINGDFVIADKENYWTQNINIRPASKEQRDLLSTKMKEAGYEWDTVNKELTKTGPKFKDGDWIVYKDDVWKVCNIALESYYELLKTNNEVSTRLIEDVDENAHLWTIADAKEGDVIVCPKYAGDTIPNIFIFKDIDIHNDVLCYCSFLKIFFATGGYIANADPINTDFYPANKEQSDLLFQKMKDAGYVWDNENKRLKLDMNGMLETKD